MDHNHLTHLPASIASLSNLWTFNASYNALTNISINLTNLTALQFLDLSHNQINSLPDIQGLHQLKKLYVQDNLLSTLLNTFGIGLDSLRELKLSNNDLTSLPESF